MNLFATTGAVFAQAAWVHFNDNGTLVYSNDNLGNHLIDYSYAGYEGGGVAIPTNQTVQQTVSAVSGDNTANIQDAINYVGGLTLDANGFRGVVLLNPGIYEMDGTLTFNSNNGSSCAVQGRTTQHSFFTGPVAHQLLFQEAACIISAAPPLTISPIVTFHWEQRAFISIARVNWEWERTSLLSDLSWPRG